MVEYRTPALVLHVYDHGESDRLVHLYTRALGRVSAIAKGARRSRRRFPGTLEILTVLDIRIVDPARSSLMRLEGARVLRPFERLVNDLGRFAVACQLAEILDRFTGEHEANPELFDFALGVLDVLTDEGADRLLALLVLAKTLARLGYRPQLSQCAVCGASLSVPGAPVAFVPRDGGVVCRSCAVGEDIRMPARLAFALDRGIRTPLRERRKLGLTSRDVRQAELLLDRFFRFHIGIELKSAAFLRDILAAERPVGAAASGERPAAQGGQAASDP
jgi:DNA repair protein RecO (recombination protein O)